ncbi:MAG: SIS domain-containing protein [Verrucomicrobiales bacterium]
MSLFENSINDAIEALELLRSCEKHYNDAVEALACAVERGNKILACGNGGSAADASHFITELLCRFREDRRPLPGVALAADGSFLTAAGNDYGFESIFARQVEGLGREGDILVAISTSGNSANVHAAIETANARGLTTITLLGRDGGGASGLADIEIVISHQDTARIQEAQKVLIHALCEGLEKRLNLI